MEGREEGKRAREKRRRWNGNNNNNGRGEKPKARDNNVQGDRAVALVNELVIESPASFFFFLLILCFLCSSSLLFWTLLATNKTVSPGKAAGTSSPPTQWQRTISTAYPATAPE